ncbi:MAG: hypothetical protein QOJ52_77 [Acidimicrobiaceae bacterium]|nr:hypothetical protein [Acidimicrobiaceae bacterium]
MDSRLTRRNFLIGAATVMGAAACSKGKGVIHVGDGQGTQLNLLVTSGAVDGPGDQALSVFEAGIDQRVAYVLTGKNGLLTPGPGTTTLQVGTDQKRLGPAVPVEVHSDTGASTNTYLTTNYRFPAVGTYWLRASFQGQTADSPVVVIDRKDAKIPLPGQKLISTPTPTDSDHRGVEPICTRTPPCPFHTQSLDDALTKHLPMALLFATPALCESAFCGPVLDTLIAAAPAYAGKINFVHSEIFTALSRNAANTPAVLAYHLQSEPVLFLADANGVVVQRIDALFGKAEATAALARLATGGA